MLDLRIRDVLNMVEWQFLIRDNIGVCIIFLSCIEFYHRLAEAGLCLGLGLDLVDSDMIRVIPSVFHGFIGSIPDIFRAVYVRYSH